MWILLIVSIVSGIIYFSIIGDTRDDDEKLIPFVLDLPTAMIAGLVGVVSGTWFLFLFFETWIGMFVVLPVVLYVLFKIGHSDERQMKKNKTKKK